MSNRPASRLDLVTPTREHSRLRSMIVVPTELVMTGASINGAQRLQNRRAVHSRLSSHNDESFRRRDDVSASHESFRQSNRNHNNPSRCSKNESFRRRDDISASHFNNKMSSHMIPSSHINESFVHSSDDDDDEDDDVGDDLKSVSSGESDLAQSPAADIIRATYTSPMFDISNRTLSTNADSAQNSVEPCPVDGCPLNPKSRVSKTGLTGIEKPHANKFKGINIFTLRNIKNPFLY